MKKRRRVSIGQIVGIALFVLAISFAVASRQNADDSDSIARCRWNDGAPLGGRGLRLVLEKIGYRTARASSRLETMPDQARVWLLLDPLTRFSNRETEALLAWVQSGGTLIWAASSPAQIQTLDSDSPLSPAIEKLRQGLKVSSTGGAPSRKLGQVLPELVALDNATPSIYWSGATAASASGGTVSIARPHLEIAANKIGPQIARIDIGSGRVFVMADALIFSNYALSKPSNAILATNLVRAHVAPGALIYFDERHHDAATDAPVSEPGLLYWLWRPPLRWAILQTVCALLLLWAFYGRRLGTPVPLREADPVTRAGQFATAMGALFHKANRPQVAALTAGEDFRRRLARQLNMSPSDSDDLLIERAHAVNGLDRALLDRLLLRSRAPSESEAAMLADAQEMEWVLSQFGAQRR